MGLLVATFTNLFAHLVKINRQQLFHVERCFGICRKTRIFFQNIGHTTHNRPKIRVRPNIQGITINL